MCIHYWIGTWCEMVNRGLFILMTEKWPVGDLIDPPFIIHFFFPTFIGHLHGRGPESVVDTEINETLGSLILCISLTGPWPCR